MLNDLCHSQYHTPQYRHRHKPLEKKLNLSAGRILWINVLNQNKLHRAYFTKKKNNTQTQWAAETERKQRRRKKFFKKTESTLQTRERDTETSSFGIRVCVHFTALIDIQRTKYCFDLVVPSIQSDFHWWRMVHCVCALIYAKKQHT